MSRLKHYTRSLFSSYLLMGVNVVYTLASMPLALHYLSKAEFGLWALTLQVAAYIGLLDLGMGSSVSRILIDHKDERSNGRYGSAVQSGFLVGLAQGAIALIVGLSIVWFVGDWLKVGEKAATVAIKAQLQHYFFWLMVGQVFITAGTFGTRMLSQILFAWQRIDISNYSAMLNLLVGLATLWIALHMGLGIYSLLIGGVVGWICGLVFNLLMCFRLGMLPHRGEWGKPNRAQFGELFSYGADVFLISLGTQLIMSSQIVLISRQLGEDVAAVWAVMTKVFTLLSQVVWRIIGNAMPAFAEMYVRGERELLWNRYRQMFITVSVLSGVCAVIFAACNGPFVQIWMHGKFSWVTINDVLLGIWLVVATQQCSHNSLIICLKEIGTLKYTYIIEGVIFVVASALCLKTAGMKGMLISSVGATLLFTWTIGTWRVSKMLGSWKGALWDWQVPLLKTLFVMVPCGFVTQQLVHNRSSWIQFALLFCFLGAVGSWVILCFAFPEDLVAEIVVKLPPRIQVPVLLFRKRFGLKKI